jgi:hypothetical protein
MRDRESLNESPSPAISKDHSMELNIRLNSTQTFKHKYRYN